MFALILFGSQGSGKGTQGGRLRDQYGFHVIDFGAELRKKAQSNHRIGDILNSGGIVDDEFVINLLFSLLPNRLPDNIVFDGFPRSIGQADWLIKHLSSNSFQIVVANLAINRHEALERIAIRYKKEGRVDDEPQTAAKRLNKFAGYAPGVIGRLKQVPRFIEIDASAEPAQVSRVLFSFIEQHHHKRGRFNPELSGGEEGVWRKAELATTA